MSNENRLSVAKFSCLQCDADNLVWPRDLDSTKELTGNENRAEVMDFLRCKRCGGEVTISGEEQRELLMSGQAITEPTLVVNRDQYKCLIRVKNKITICCGDTKVILESDNDKVLGGLAGTLLTLLNSKTTGVAAVTIPESVSVSLV